MLFVSFDTERRVLSQSIMLMFIANITKQNANKVTELVEDSVVNACDFGGRVHFGFCYFLFHSPPIDVLYRLS